jgi:glycerophosphoryl diester phosphodiesterase
MIFAATPTVVGHRGFGAGDPGGYPENTMASYQAALDCGLTWLELDVQRSRDGQLVIRHDPVTPAGDLVVSRTAAELAAAGILPFAQVMAALPPGVGVNIDVKTIVEDAADPAQQCTGPLVGAALRELAGSRPLLVTSFDPALLVYLRDLGLPDIPLGLITAQGFPAWHALPAARGLGLAAISMHAAAFGLQRDVPRAVDREPAELIERAHHAGLAVMAWCPGPAEAARLAAAGVDAVCVNDVPGVLAAVAPEPAAAPAPGRPVTTRPRRLRARRG